MKHLTTTFLLSLILFSGCQSKHETISPVRQDITESVYASGLIVSKNQYQVFATVSGIVDEVFADEGASVEIGSPILSIVNDTQQLMANNAQSSAQFNALNFNRGKIDEAQSFATLAKNQMENDSLILERQKNLWVQNIGTKVTLEQRELAFKNSKNSYSSALEKLKEIKKQLDYLSKQAENNLLISNKNNGDYLLKSKIKGKVYKMNLVKGEIVTPQIPVAIIGDDEKYLLEMQVDESNIVKIRPGQLVLVSIGLQPS